MKSRASVSAIVIVASLALVACAAPGAEPSASSVPSAAASTIAQPSETITPTAEPSVQATAAPSVGEPTVQRDVTAVTTADRIRVRETPSADSAQVNQLEAGTRVIVISDPVADPSDPALEWWYVMPSEAPCPSCEIDMRPGWMTTGPDKSWLRAVTPVCPDRPTFTAQTWDHGYWPPVLLQCFGNDPIVFEGVIDYICCPGITFGVTEPSWLARPFYDGSGGVARLTAEDISWGPEFHLDPASGVELGERGTVARLTGHFDDPAAQGCVTTVDQPDLEANPDLRYVTDAPLAIWGCRNSFVVDDVEVLDFIPLPTRAPQG